MKLVIILLIISNFAKFSKGAGKKVADILGSEKVVTTSSILGNSVKKASENIFPNVHQQSSSNIHPEQSTASSDPIIAGILRNYPLITMKNDYNKEAPPRPSKGGPVKVEFYILLIDIRDIYEVEEMMTLEFNLQMYWRDERLTQWENINSSIILEAKKRGERYAILSSSIIDHIWHPDAFIDHAKSIEQHVILTKPASLRLYYNGEFRYSGRFTLTIACRMDFYHYPADTQKCPVNFKSYSYDNTTVWTKWRGGKEPKMKAMTLPNFRPGIAQGKSEGVGTSSNDYSEIKFIIILKRLLMFHMIQTYIPSCLFVVISFLTFLVNQENVLECLTLCMTTLLTLTAMFAAVKQNTPTVSYVKGLDIWMVTCIFCVFFTLLEHTVLLKLRAQISDKVTTSTKLAEIEAEKRHQKKRKSLFSNESRSRSRSTSKGAISRPSQEPLTSKEKFGSPNGGTSGSDSDSQNDLQLRRFPQPTPPSVHLSAPPSAIMSYNGADPVSPNFMTQRMSITPSHTPLMINPEGVLLSTPIPPMLSKKAAKNFNLSKSVEFFCSKLIPLSFLLFNIIYWPWLFLAGDYFDESAFQENTTV